MTVNELAIKCKTDSNYITELWLAVYKLIVVWAKRYVNINNPRYSIEDLIQSAYFALIKAIEQYPADSEYNFTTYLNRHCKNEFNAVCGIRSSKREPYLYSLDVPTTENESCVLADTIADESAAADFETAENDIYNSQLKQALDKAMDIALNEQAKQVIHARFYDNMTFNAIGEQLGITRDCVRRVEGSALRMLRQGKALRILKEFDYYSHGIKFTGITTFRYTFESSVEMAVIRKLDIEDRVKSFQDSKIENIVLL